MKNTMKPLILLSCLTALTVFAACGLLTPTESDHNGLVSCVTPDGGVLDGGADLAVVHDLAKPNDLTPPRDMWAPQCTYHWVLPKLAGYRKIGIQDPIVLKATYEPLYAGQTPNHSDASKQYLDNLYAMPDPKNPLYAVCRGCSDRPTWAWNPHVSFTVDITVTNMPHFRRKNPMILEFGQIDLNLLFGETNIDPKTMVGSWVTPASDRRMDPGHYTFDFTLAGKVSGIETWLILNNEDRLDDPSGYVTATIVLGDVTSTQPCKGYLPGDD